MILKMVLKNVFENDEQVAVNSNFKWPQKCFQFQSKLTKIWSIKQVELL